MRTIPVLDLLGGVVVRGIGGRRDEYLPIQSSLCTSADPVAIARALVAKFSPAEVYVADLDAITGKTPAWQLYADIAAATKLPLLVDAGVMDADGARQLHARLADSQGGGATVLGLESLASPRLLREIVANFPAEQLVFSLDLKDGSPLANRTSWRGATAIGIASEVFKAGVRRMIILDLADVGMGNGVSTLGLCRELRAAFPAVELIAGGGVRGPEDLRNLAEAGCNAALVASALHDGRIPAVTAAAPLA